MTTKVRSAGTSFVKYVTSSEALLTPAAGSLTATWTLPTTNTAGAAIGTIQAQRIAWDTVSRMGTDTPYTYWFPVDSISATTKAITGLPALTTIYFAMQVKVNGVWSEPGAEASGTTA